MYGKILRCRILVDNGSIVSKPSKSPQSLFEHLLHVAALQIVTIQTSFPCFYQIVHEPVTTYIFHPRCSFTRYFIVLSWYQAGVCWLHIGGRNLEKCLPHEQNVSWDPNRIEGSWYGIFLIPEFIKSLSFYLSTNLVQSNIRQSWKKDLGIPQAGKKVKCFSHISQRQIRKNIVRCEQFFFVTKKQWRGCPSYNLKISMQ